MNKDLVSIIIINWNGLQHLEKCLPSIFKTTYPEYEVILVDNGSTDDSTKFIRTNFPQIKIVQNNENLGFAEANNIGFENSCGEYIFLLNNDVILRDDSFKTALNYFKDQIIKVFHGEFFFLQLRLCQIFREQYDISHQANL